MADWESSVTSELTTNPAANDLYLVRDEDDTTDGSDGTDKKVQFKQFSGLFEYDGSDNKVYWTEYNTTDNRFELKSSDIDGGGTTGDLLRVSDGEQRVRFQGDIVDNGASNTIWDAANTRIGTDLVDGTSIDQSIAPTWTGSHTFNAGTIFGSFTDFSNTTSQTASGTNGSYTTSGDSAIFVDTATNSTAFTVTLASSDASNGRRIFIKDSGGGAGANNITVDTEGSETIDGSSSVTLDANNESVEVISDGSNFFVLSRLQGGGVL